MGFVKISNHKKFPKVGYKLYKRLISIAKLLLAWAIESVTISFEHTLDLMYEMLISNCVRKEYKRNTSKNLIFETQNLSSLIDSKIQKR